jgi:hypothetical protein
MKYSRRNLATRGQWRKIVYVGQFGELGRDNDCRLATVRNALCEEIYRDDQWLVRGGFGFTLIMLDPEADYIWLKLKLGIKPDEHRGVGDWANHKYNSRVGNRIPA